MGRYVQNTTIYGLKWPKRHQKVPKFNKITLSTLSPPLRLIHIFKINNIHIKEFFYPHAATPPPSLIHMHCTCTALYTVVHCALDHCNELHSTRIQYTEL